MIKSAEDVQQGTLPRSRLAHNRQHLAALHLKRQIFKEHQVRFAGPENLLQSLNPEQRFLFHFLFRRLQQEDRPSSHTTAQAPPWPIRTIWLAQAGQPPREPAEHSEADRHTDSRTAISR